MAGELRLEDAIGSLLGCRGSAARLSGRASICDTVVPVTRIVLPRHANPFGRMHGGRVMEWVVDAATLAAARVARGPVVIASMDYMFFLNPIYVGDVFNILAWVSYTGRTSMEVGVLAWSRGVEDTRVTTYAHLAAVAVDERLRPRPIPVKVEPREDWEKVLEDYALARRRERLPLIERRREAVSDIEPPEPLWENMKLVNYRIVMPEDTIYADALHAGRLLYWLDETAGVLGSKYTRGIVVTASVDATAFYTPVEPGEIVEIHSAITYTGRTTLEVTMKTIVADPVTGAKKHTTTAYFTMVNLGGGAGPQPIPRREPPPGKERLLEEARARRERRLRLLSEIKEVAKRIGELLAD